MPLVKIFARQVMTKPIPLPALQQKLCDIWGTKPNTTKLMLQRVEDWTDESFQEDCYVDIRAYGKSRTAIESLFLVVALLFCVMSIWCFVRSVFLHWTHGRSIELCGMWECS